MKVLPFTIPVSHDKSIILTEEDLPFFYTHLHRHQEIQLTWIRSGEGVLIAGTNMHVFRPGEIYLIGANLPHVFKSDPLYFLPDSTLRVKTVTLFFNPAASISGLFNLPEMKQINAFLADSKNGFKVSADLYSIISGMLQHLLKTEGIDQVIHFTQLMKVLSEASRPEPLSVSTPSVNISDKEGTRLANIYNYIIQNHSKTLTLQDVAEQACMTPHAFCRYFKKHTKYTLVGFLNKVRINEACKILTSGTQDSISTVAYSCGFNSMTNFNRVFKSVTGKSPSNYIAQYIN